MLRHSVYTGTSSLVPRLLKSDNVERLVVVDYYWRGNGALGQGATVHLRRLRRHLFGQSSSLVWVRVGASLPVSIDAFHLFRNNHDAFFCCYFLLGTYGEICQWDVSSARRGGQGTARLHMIIQLCTNRLLPLPSCCAVASHTFMKLNLFWWLFFNVVSVVLCDWMPAWCVVGEEGYISWSRTSLKLWVINILCNECPKISRAKLCGCFFSILTT